jgi:sugar O-acyltransferase (sialic acid O-acetyltransferase NeuD family)
MAKIIVFGAGQLAEVAYFYLTNDSPHEVVAFTADEEYCTESLFHGLPVVSFEKINEDYPPSDYKMLIPISYKKVNKVRERKFEEARNKGYEFISYISSKATVWPGLKHGENCMIFENNVIQPFVEIGDNVILWSGNHIGHHTVIKENCFIASHVVVSGNVAIGPNCFLGVNSTIRDNIKIARENIIGAGALILEDTQEQGVYIGSPATLSRVPSNRLRKI